MNFPSAVSVTPTRQKGPRPPVRPGERQRSETPPGRPPSPGPTAAPQKTISPPDQRGPETGKAEGGRRASPPTCCGPRPPRCRLLSQHPVQTPPPGGQGSVVRVSPTPASHKPTSTKPPEGWGNGVPVQQSCKCQENADDVRSPTLRPWPSGLFSARQACGNGAGGPGPRNAEKQVCANRPASRPSANPGRHSRLPVRGALRSPPSSRVTVLDVCAFGGGLSQNLVKRTLWLL